MTHQMVLVLDFGGQYNQLIARRVRECGVYCEVHPYHMPLEEIKARNPIGIIFTGGPNSVYLDGSPKVAPEIFQMEIPVLGLCYGCQLMAHTLHGEVKSAPAREFGKTETDFQTDSLLFRGLPEWLDEPQRLHRQASRRLSGGGLHGGLSGGGHGKPGAKALWDAVPSRSITY